jgi:polyisoprenoid-binding protein YceI
MKTQHFNIVNTKSSIRWIGRKVTGAHNGTIALKEGNFVLEDGVLVQGHFIINMNSIVIEDITDLAANRQFAAHLASDDFFNIDEYPEAWFDISKATSYDEGRYTIDGSLTIKGTTKAINFDATVRHEGTQLLANARIVVDRTQFGIKFRSGNFFKDLGDTLIYNDFVLEAQIEAELASQTVARLQPTNLN